MSKQAWALLAIGSVLIVLTALFWPQEKPPETADFSPAQRPAATPEPAQQEPPALPQSPAAHKIKQEIAPPDQTQPPPEPKPKEYVLATGKDRVNYYTFSLVSSYEISGPRTLPSKPATSLASVVAIEGDIAGEYPFRITVPIWAHEYATDLRFRISNRFDPGYESLYADFLYTATVPGRYRLKLAKNPLRVESFERVAEFMQPPEFKPPKNPPLPLKR